MKRALLLRVTTVPISFYTLLKGQLAYMSEHFEVHAASSPGWELTALEGNEKVIVHSIPMKRTPAPVKDFISLLKLWALILKIRPTIVHSHTPKAGLLSMVASYVARVPIRLHTVAGIPWIEYRGRKRSFYRFLEKMTYRFSTHVYSNSIELRDFIINNKLTSPVKIKVIGYGSSNGIDLRYFNRDLVPRKEIDELREKYNLKGNRVILFVGRIVKDKGIEELLAAFNILKIDHNVKLLLVGPYEKARDPISISAEQIMMDDTRVVCTGFVDDVRPFMELADVLAFPSYREGLPNVPMQACAMGLPCVVSDISGCREIVQDGINGLIVPPKDINALKNALHRLLSDGQLYNQIVSRSRAYISERFDQTTVWEGILHEYNRHIGNV